MIFLTVNELAEMTELHPNTIRTYISHFSFNAWSIGAKGRTAGGLRVDSTSATLFIDYLEQKRQIYAAKMFRKKLKEVENDDRNSANT